MNPVPWKYRNVINPWQTPKEIQNAVAWIDRMLAKSKYSEAEIAALLLHDREWNWNKPS